MYYYYNNNTNLITILICYICSVRVNINIENIKGKEGPLFD